MEDEELQNQFARAARNERLDETGLKFTMVDFKIAYDSKFDGKFYPCTGPTIVEGWTMSAKKTGPRCIDLVEQFNGPQMT